MKINDIIQRPDLTEDATGGSTSAGAIATIPGVGTGAKVGTLFGGSFGEPIRKKKRKK